MKASEKLAQRAISPEFQMGVRKYRAVLDFVTDIEDELRRRKKKKSWLAEQLGQSRARISTIFRKKPNLTFFTAVELANALDMDVEVHARPRCKVLSMEHDFRNVAATPFRANAPLYLVSDAVRFDIANNDDIEVASGVAR